MYSSSENSLLQIDMKSKRHEGNDNEINQFKLDDADFNDFWG